jgi:small-conductance mechanosensitive channel
MQFLSRFDIIALMMTPTFWVGVATVVFVTLLVYWLLTRLIAFVKKGITTWGDKHPTTNRMRFILSDMLNRTSRILLFVVALLFSLRFVDLPDHLFGTVSHAWFLVFAIQVALWMDQGVVSWLRHVMLAPGSHKNPVTLVITGLILRAIVWSVMLLSILANAGVNITALVASLGVGGLPSLSPYKRS